MPEKGCDSMPRGDGTGPRGDGPMTGRGLGPCSSVRQANRQSNPRMRLGLGFNQRCGYGHGFGRGVIINQDTAKAQK